MVTYPHHLLRVTASGAYQDEHGAFVQGGTPTTEYVCKCRYEVDGRGTEINVGDDRHVKVTGVVYTAPSDVTFESGEIISVAKDSDGTNEIARLEVVSSDNGRLHNRIWVR